MLYRKGFMACLMLVSLLVMVSCNSAASSPSWTLAWIASASAAQSNAPDVAYAACVHVQTPGGAVVSPAENTWLATGSQPRVGLALSRLDPAGQFFAISIVSIDPGANRWQLTDSGSLARPFAGNGSQGSGNGWKLPPGTYNSIALEVPDTPPGGSVQLWLSAEHQEFVLARLYSTIQPPATSTSVMLSNQPGWLTTQGRFTIVALRLTSGIYAGLGTLIFAGTTGVQQSEQLAAQAAANLNDIFPS